MKIILQITGFSILLAITGFLIHTFFTTLSFHQLKDVNIISTQAGTEYLLKLIFCAALASVPVLYLAMRQILKLTTVKHIFFSVSAIFLTGIIFWQYRINSLNTRLKEISQIKTDIHIRYLLPRENLYLELYLFLGFIIGAIIGSVALYRFKTRNG